MKSRKIVADSSSDVLSLKFTPYSAAPLKIIAGEREFTDDVKIDVKEMVDYLDTYKGKSSTSCPNCSDWTNAFGQADEIFCITITGTLSGSFNAAVMAKHSYEEEHPDRKVYVMNSLTAGPEIALIIEKLEELVNSDLTFEEICKQINEYKENTALLFMLSSMKNLANNGRVSPVVSKMAGILGIRVVGRASEKGDLQPLNKCRGEKKALDCIIKNLSEMGYKGGKINIAHCFNESEANILIEKIKTEHKKAQIKLYACRGLCSFYAEKGGMLIGFEK